MTSIRAQSQFPPPCHRLCLPVQAQMNIHTKTVNHVYIQREHIMPQPNGRIQEGAAEREEERERKRSIHMKGSTRTCHMTCHMTCHTRAVGECVIVVHHISKHKGTVSHFIEFVHSSLVYWHLPLLVFTCFCLISHSHSVINIICISFVCLQFLTVVMMEPTVTWPI